MTEEKTFLREKHRLVWKCKRLFGCDTARISCPLDRMFLIIGFRKSTKQDRVRDPSVAR